MYEIVFCDCCGNIDSEANTTYTDDETYHHKNKASCLSSPLDTTKEETIRYLRSLLCDRLRISSKTCASPSRDVYREYLKRFKMGNYKKSTIWNLYWDCLDYLVKNENKQDTKKFQKCLEFVKDNTY